MLINVFNKETASVEKVEVSKIDTKIHFHRNTHEAFTKEDLEWFWVKTEAKKQDVKTEAK